MKSKEFNKPNNPTDNLYESRPNAEIILGRALATLLAEGEDVNPAFLDKIDNEELIIGLLEAAEPSGIPIAEYIRHSNRFSNINRFGEIFGRGSPIVIEESEDNLYQSGRLRPSEMGYTLSFQYLEDNDIDPSLVLYFRATQPSDVPKPEYYWTSDFGEVKNGLGRELGNHADTAVILVSTLKDIANNGGLMSDINDDSGIAVRQIGLGTYDQSRALFILPRN
ncbi:hypothetical protein KA025_00315 [Candidatus Saccharibacteria bacterium]|jgi:hypothetical protein|nr:hypothetical protein [Candidatus Saccharibacteria bacterium]MBP7834515.1 hypothetical protein [Candidatus Saccharibacteria bacterium]